MNESPEEKGGVDPAVAERRAVLKAGAEVAAGLLWHDRRYIFGIFPLLIIASLIPLFTVSTGVTDYIWYSLLERFLSLLVLFLVSHRWMRTVSGQSIPYSLSSLLRIMVVGFLLWGALITPFVLAFVAGPIPYLLRLCAALAIVPAAIVNLRYFFFFIPCALTLPSLGELLVVSRSFTHEDLLRGLKVIVPPLGIMSLITATISALSPDGRSLTISLLVTLSAGIFPLLSTYLALAVGLEVLGKRSFLFRDLDPYLGSRLRTVAIQGPAWLSHILQFTPGFRVLLLSLLVWGGNTIRASEMKPAPSFEVVGVEPARDTLKLTLKARDPDFHFRGFEPLNFMVAGESGTIISSRPSEASIDDGTNKIIFGFPHAEDEYTFTLSFPIEHRSGDYTHLEDLHLWYRKARLMPLQLHELKGVEGNKNKEKGEVRIGNK